MGRLQLLRKLRRSYTLDLLLRLCFHQGSESLQKKRMEHLAHVFVHVVKRLGERKGPLLRAVPSQVVTGIFAIEYDNLRFMSIS